MHEGSILEETENFKDHEDEIGTMRSRWLGRRVAQLPDGLTARESDGQLWEQRDERAEHRADFIDRFMSKLPAKFRDRLEEVYWERLTHDDAAGRDGVESRSHYAALARARQALVRLIALEDPAFVEQELAARNGRGRPARNYEAELEAAMQVLLGEGILAAADTSGRKPPCTG